MERNSPGEGRFKDAEGSAALSICEALLNALVDLNIIDERELRGLLTDVETTHTEAASHSKSPEMHQTVAAIVQRILDGKNLPLH